MEEIKILRNKGKWKQNISLERDTLTNLPTDYREIYDLRSESPFLLKDIRISLFYLDGTVIVKEVDNILKTIATSENTIRNNKFPVEFGFASAPYKELYIISDKIVNNGLVRYSNRNIIDVRGRIPALSTFNQIKLIISAVIEFQD